MPTLLRWTPEEDAKLLQAKQTMTAKEIVANVFPHRSIGSINMRVEVLKRQASPDYYTDVYRECPRCKQPTRHANKTERDRMVSRGLICRKCSWKEYGTKLLGANNPFYGHHHSQESKDALSKAHTGKKLTEEHKAKCVPYILAERERVKDYLSFWIDRLGEEKGRKRFKEHQKLLSERTKGKNNGMYGKPSPQGSGNGWKGWYKGIYFRSIREMAFYIRTTEVEGRKCVNIHMQKAYKVPYVHPFSGAERTYTPDFLVDENLVVEIKPLKLMNTVENQAKFKAAKAFFAQKGLAFEVIDIQPDSSLLKDKYLQKEITFQNRYEDRFRQYIGLAP